MLLSENPLRFAAMDVSRKTGNELFQSSGNNLPHRLSDFWKWAVSDLVSNATRGILAEFIVASAFGEVAGVRKEWDAYDLNLPDGTKIEVKSTAYCQSWAQKDYSKPEFSIKPSYGWDANTNLVSAESKRQADIYVFCLLSEKNRSSIDPMNFDQWEFFLLSARSLNEKFPFHKKIGLNSLLKLNPSRVTYGSLVEGIAELAEQLKID